jgi:hypothetical protein
LIWQGAELLAVQYAKAQGFLAQAFDTMDMIFQCLDMSFRDHQAIFEDLAAPRGFCKIGSGQYVEGCVATLKFFKMASDDDLTYPPVRL